MSRIVRRPDAFLLALVLVAMTFVAALPGTARAQSPEATFADYAAILCPTAINRGLIATRAVEDPNPPTDINDSFPDGPNGEYTHLAEPAPCLSAFVDRLPEPQRSNYQATLNGLRAALATCAGSGWKLDAARGSTFNPTFDYRNAVAAFAGRRQGGDSWGGCLSRKPLSDFPTREAIIAGVDPLQPAPGSVINSVIFCRDDRSTPGPDHVDCATSFADQWAKSRAAEQASQSDMTLFTELRSQSAAIRDALGVGLDTNGGYGTIPGFPNSGIGPGQQAAAPLLVADLQTIATG